VAGTIEKSDMNDTAIIAKAVMYDGGAATPAPPRRLFFIAVVIVAIGLLIVAATALYSEKAMSAAVLQGGSKPPMGAAGWMDVLERQYHTALTIALSATVGCSLVALVALAGGLMSWHRRWQRFCDEREKEWRKKAAVLHGQIAESRGNSEAIERSRSESGENLARLEKQNAALQSELEQLKRSEKTLSQQRQMLESSKAVLELHVQERTVVLQKLKRSYELILNSAGDGICGLDLNGKATFINPAAARMTGWSTGELIGKTEREIFSGNSAKAGAAPAGGNTEERIIIRKDGSRFPVEFVRTPIEENGRQTGSVVIFKDIADRKRAELTIAQKVAELGRSNAELEQFAFVASHDLQEPLRKIQSFGDRLKVKCNGSIGADALNYLERMQNASARMRTLIDDLLAFSRVIRDSKPFVDVDLGKAAREVLGDLEVLLEKTGGRVDVGELPTIEADSMQMRQLLLNLIGNALKFQPPDGKPVVKVSAREVVTAAGEPRCELTVQDNGIGFEEEYAEKIFAVFQRLHGRGEYEGTGVGLAICRRITDRHQGTIVAHSQLGEGATFVINLPVRQPRHEPHPEHTPENSPEANQQVAA
jgi:PAS domain S-box-containing protein